MSKCGRSSVAASDRWNAQRVSISGTSNVRPLNVTSSAGFVEDRPRARRASRCSPAGDRQEELAHAKRLASNHPQPARNASVPAPPLSPVVSRSKNTTRRAQSGRTAGARIEQRQAARRDAARSCARAGGRASHPAPRRDRSTMQPPWESRARGRRALGRTRGIRQRRRHVRHVGQLAVRWHLRRRGPAGRCSRRRAARSRMAFDSGRGSRGGRQIAQAAGTRRLGQRTGRAFGADARRAAGLARTAVDQLARAREQLRRACRNSGSLKPMPPG